MEKNRKKRFWIVMISLGALSLVLNGLTFVNGFADFYMDHFYLIFSAPIAKVVGLIPFSVTAVLIVVTVLYCLFLLVCALILPFRHKKEKYVRFFMRILRGAIAAVLVFVLLITLTYLVPSRQSKLEINGHGNKEYSTEELKILRNYIVENLNEMSVQMERDEYGFAAYSGDREAEMKKTFLKFAEENPRFRGGYVKSKNAVISKINYYQGILSTTYAPTMEINENRYLSQVNKPQTHFHELAHVKGYYYEDEANYWSFRIATQSDNAFIRYSGWQLAYSYVDNAFYLSVDNGVDQDEYFEQIQLNEGAAWDSFHYWDYGAEMKFLEELSEQEEEFLTETAEKIDQVDDKVDEIAEPYIPKTYYDHVTYLLLQYYDGILYNKGE